MLGKQSLHADESLKGQFIGADFGIKRDLSADLHDDWRVFNQNLIPAFLAVHPQKSKIAAGLACGALWTVAKGIQIGDMVLCPDGTGLTRVAEVTGNYQYTPDGVLPHRRAVRWLNITIDRNDMSESLRRSYGYIGTVSDLSAYAAELEILVSGSSSVLPLPVEQTVQDATAFALEKHLEAFLIENWAQIELGKEYDLFQEDGAVGQQFPTDTGPLDILCISKDKKKLLVVELKRGRASDAVVGQILRYMGYIKEMIAED